MRSLNGTPMPSAHQNFRLNWASFGVGTRNNQDAAGGVLQPGGGQDHSIFVGDLPPEVNDFMLQVGLASSPAASECLLIVYR